jgi:hypothetical protein
MSDLDPARLFAQVAPEITRFLEAKGARPSDSWRDFSPVEHAHAFTVARTAGYDVLGDIRASVERAIRERRSFEQFRADLEPTLQAKGWWGRATDPATGEIVRLGSPRRLRTIFWANTRTAWAAGEWEKIERTKDVLPYLIYVESTAAEKRAEHLAWVGTILPVDDPWWREHYPPNGWGCMCRVRQISESEARRAGFDPDAPARPPSFGRRQDVNLRTGEIVETPVGVDPGWNSNPGLARSRAMADLISGRVEAMSEEARRTATADIAGSWLARRMLAGAFAAPAAPGAPGSPPATAAAASQAADVAVPVASLPEGVAGARTLRLTAADAPRVATGERGLADLQPLIDDPATTRDRVDARRVVLLGLVGGRRMRAEIDDDGVAPRLISFGPE